MTRRTVSSKRCWIESAPTSGDGKAAREATLTWETMTALAAHTRPSMARRPVAKGPAAIIVRMSHREHRAASPACVRCYVLTVSDTRTEETDTGGRLLRELLAGCGHDVLGHAIVPDEPATLRAALVRQLESEAVQAVITTGGTGISRRDGSYEVLTALMDKRVDGFGELFRALSFEERGF